MWPIPLMGGHLRPVTSYEQICVDLRQGFIRRGDPEDHVRLVGLLFARPTSQLAKDEVIPNLPYFHERSGDNVNFYCGGYWNAALPPAPEIGRVQIANGWTYAEAKFVEFRRDIEARSTWSYSGGVDLILTNARYTPKGGWRSLFGSHPADEIVIDFSSAISANLDAMKRDGAIVSVETFFESVFRYAEDQNGKDPAWGFSDQQGARIAGSALKRLVFSVLPRGLSEEARKAAHFAVVDIAKQRTSR